MTDTDQAEISALREEVKRLKAGIAGDLANLWAFASEAAPDDMPEGTTHEQVREALSKMQDRAWLADDLTAELTRITADRDHWERSWRTAAGERQEAIERARKAEAAAEGLSHGLANAVDEAERLRLENARLAGRNAELKAAAAAGIDLSGVVDEGVADRIKARIKALEVDAAFLKRQLDEARATVGFLTGFGR